jgi:ribosomal-protein-alanine N-acetyltransferase
LSGPGPIELPDGVLLRPVRPDDAPALLDTLLRNRDILRASDVERPDSFWTLEGQRTRIDLLVRQEAAGALVARVLMRGDKVVGYAALSGITRAPVFGCSVGYWVDAADHGRGLASAAVEALLRIADENLGLHRVEAGTNPANLASQRVLTRNGFTLYGTAHSHMFVNGAWHDSNLYERILNNHPPRPS